MLNCVFHPDTKLKGLSVFQLNVGTESVLVCHVCANAFRNGEVRLFGL